MNEGIRKASTREIGCLRTHHCLEISKPLISFVVDIGMGVECIYIFLLFTAPQERNIVWIPHFFNERSEFTLQIILI